MLMITKYLLNTTLYKLRDTQDQEYTIQVQVHLPKLPNN